jgi:hypothetical protein
MESGSHRGLGLQFAFPFSMSFAQPNSKGAETAPGRDFIPQPVVQQCWAVVSFALEDAVWCDWIYREFDGTRVPRPLVSRPSRQGTPYPERMSVSPDPADPQQLENYAETLKVAQHLIIVVSPSSSRENLLQEHMRIFRAEGGEERIIALVVKGEPASPSAEPGTEGDKEWLPKWLQYRFKSNRFEPGPPCEPLVVDARLGVSSLAEVRARLCAALLEVPVTQLGELGVMIRSSVAEMAIQASASPVIVSMPEPTPLPTLAAIAAPEVEPSPKHPAWPVVLCATAAVLALGFLALWPAKEVPEPPPALSQKAQRKVEKQATTEMSEPKPLVAVVPVPIPENPVLELEARPPAGPVTAPLVSVNTPTAPAPPQAAPPPLTAVVPVTPADPNAVAIITPAAPATMSKEGEAAERKLYELASRRDRLVRLAETKGNAGETEEALAAFQQAIETAHELVNRTDGGRDEVVEMALLYRRCGNFAAGVNSTAEGRLYYERGKRALQVLKAKGKLPNEAMKVLADLEAATKAGRE